MTPHYKYQSSNLCDFRHNDVFLYFPKFSLHGAKPFFANLEKIHQIVLHNIYIKALGIVLSVEKCLICSLYEPK